MKKGRLIVYSFLIFAIFTACKDEKKEYLKIVGEWSGKEVVFPSHVTFTLYGKDTVPDPYCGKESKYKILTYIDTLGCTSCKLKFSEWKRLMDEIDSLHVSVEYYFYLFPRKLRDVQFLLKKEKFTHPVCVDTEDELNRLNHFPSDEMFQTFLLDKDNKVVVIGNPIQNPAVKALYLDQITGKKKENSQLKTKLTVENKEANLGNVSLSSGGKEAVFVLRNTGEHPLLIMDVTTTCGCTQPEYEKKFILPGKDTKITVLFTPEEEGFFNKVITVHCNTEGSPFRLNLKGNVVK